jgi:hypothetical protein
MQSKKMEASAVTILLALLILRAQADEFTLSDALLFNRYVQHNMQTFQFHVILTIFFSFQLTDPCSEIT